MSLTDRFAPWFDASPRLLGQRLFQQNRCLISLSSAGEVHAQVRDNRVFEVSFPLENPTIESLQCSCPIFRSGHLCHHIWAALLAHENTTDPVTTQSEAIWRMQLQKSLSLAATLKNRPERKERTALKLTVVCLPETHFRYPQHALVRFLFQEQTLKGWGTLKEKRLLLEDIERFESAADRDLLRDSFLGTIVASRFLEDEPFADSSRTLLSADLAADIFRRASQLGILYLDGNRSKTGSSESADLIPISFNRDRLLAHLEMRAEGDVIHVQPVLKGSVSDIRFQDLHWLGLSYAVIGKQLYRVQDEASPFDPRLIERNPWVLTRSQLPDFLDEFVNQRAGPPLAIPAHVGINLEQIKPQLHVRLESSQGTHSAFRHELYFRYGSVDYSSRSEEKIKSKFDRTRNAYFSRDVTIERELLNQWDQSFQEDHTWSPKELQSLFLQAQEQGWLVTADHRPVRGFKPLGLQLQSSGVDWFEITARWGTDENTQMSREQLQEMLQNNQNTIVLADGTMGWLDPEALAKLTFIDKLTDSKNNGKIGVLQAALLAQVLGGEELTHEVREKLHRFLVFTPPELVPTLTEVLRPYQKVGVQWMLDLYEKGIGGILADDMGLGKTLQLLTLLRHLPVLPSQPHLIVVPKTLVFNWEKEIKSFAAGLRVHVYTGTSRSLEPEDVNNYDVIITTYPIVLRDFLHLQKFKFHALVFDEAHVIKNIESQTHMACRSLKAKVRFVATGTPVENSALDLVALMQIIGGHQGFFPQARTTVKDSDRKTLEQLSRAVKPFLLRRRKHEVLKDLPEKTEQDLFIELSPAEKKVYRGVRNHFWSQIQKSALGPNGKPKNQMTILEGLLRLRQVCCHPELYLKNQQFELSSKLEFLFDQLEALQSEGHKALLFSQFTQFLDLIQKQMVKRGLKHLHLDGKTKNRQALVERFQEDPDIPFFLISLKAGGVGLNLTAASYVYILDPWWNPAAENQAIDRTHRIGQNKKVMAYRLIAKDTIEEKILELQNKKKIVRDLLVEDQAEIALKSLTMSDLEILFAVD